MNVFNYRFPRTKFIYVAGNCGNQAFPEMPRQLRKYFIFPYFLMKYQIPRNRRNSKC
jgi:hypothetical protein